MFELEVSMYQKFLPAMKEAAKEVAEDLSFPEVYFADLKAGVIIMENLKLKDYYMKAKDTCKSCITRHMSSMIPSAKPTVPPVEIIIFRPRLYCKVGTDVRTFGGTDGNMCENNKKK